MERALYFTGEFDLVFGSKMWTTIKCYNQQQLVSFKRMHLSNHFQVTVITPMPNNSFGSSRNVLPFCPDFCLFWTSFLHVWHLWIGICTRPRWVLKIRQRHPRWLFSLLLFFFLANLPLPLSFSAFGPSSLFLSHVNPLFISSVLPSFLSSGPAGAQRGSEHFQAAQTHQQQSAAVRPRHHQLPDIHLRRPGAGAQRPRQRATLRWHVSQLASQRLWHVRELHQRGSRSIQNAATAQIAFSFWINVLYITVGVVLAEAGVERSASCPWRSEYYPSAKDTWTRNTNVSADTFAKYLPTRRFSRRADPRWAHPRRLRSQQH